MCVIICLGRQKNERTFMSGFIGPKRHVYLCAILDLYSRKCIAWEVSDRIDAKLACDTLQIAINTRKPTEPIIFHSDQGSQFKSASFRRLLDEHQIACFLLQAWISL